MSSQPIAAVPPPESPVRQMSAWNQAVLGLTALCLVGDLAIAGWLVLEESRQNGSGAWEGFGYLVAAIVLVPTFAAIVMLSIGFQVGRRSSAARAVFLVFAFLPAAAPLVAAAWIVTN